MTAVVVESLELFAEERAVVVEVVKGATAVPAVLVVVVVLLELLLLLLLLMVVVVVEVATSEGIVSFQCWRPTSGEGAPPGARRARSATACSCTECAEGQLAPLLQRCKRDGK